MVSHITIGFAALMTWLSMAAPAFAMIGGTVTTNPYEVQFGMCTGTMIAPNIILTAAHCVMLPTPSGNIELLAKAGDAILVTAFNGAGTKQKYMTRVKGVAAHPSWEKSLKAQSKPNADVAADSPEVSDVGVIVLTEQIPSAYAKLPTETGSFRGKRVSIFGAGCTALGAPQTIGTLKAAEVAVADESSNRILIGIDDSLTGQSAGICRGDSGAGAFVDNQIVAVNSIMAGALVAGAAPAYLARLDRPEVIAWLRRVMAYKVSGGVAASVRP